MEVYKRQVGYEDLGRTDKLVVTATTLYFPFFLKQSYEDIGIYTDAENPTYDIVDLSGFWNLSNTGSGNRFIVVGSGTVGSGTVGGGKGSTTGTFGLRSGGETNSFSTSNDSSTSVGINEKPITQFGGQDGMLTSVINGTLPQNVEWTGPNGFKSTNPTITGLESGNYVLKVTDINNNVSYASYFLQQPQGLNVNLTTLNSQTNATFGCNGSASVTPQGGQPPYTYLWYSGNPSNALGTTTGLTSLCAGDYTVTITDASGTIVSTIFNITEPVALSGHVITTVNIDCQGGDTGSIWVQAEGGIGYTGYTYELTGPMSQTNYTGIFNGLSVGTYNVKITDNVGAFVNVPITLTQPISVTYTYSKSSYGYVGYTTNVSCFNAIDGAITVNPVGGSGTYNITLNKTNTPTGSFFTTTNGSYTFNILEAGSYSISITDSNTCPGPVVNLDLTRPPLLENSIQTPVQVNGYDIPCNGGSVVLTATTFYTTGTYVSGYPTIPSNFHKYYVDNVLYTQCTTSGCSFGPSNSSSSALLSLSAGTHTITTVDKFGCSATTTVTLSEPGPIYIMTGITDSTTGTTCTGCAINDCRQAIIVINGGVPPYSISWSDGSSSITSYSHCVGSTVSVTITDANGCIFGPQNITLSP